MPVSPEAKQKTMHDLAKRDAKRLEDALLEALDKGWLIFRKGQPRMRLQGYESNTLSEDVPLVLDPDYLWKLKIGLAPELKAVQMIKARDLWAQAQQVGANDAVFLESIGPQPPEGPMLWPILLTSIPAVFAVLANDYRSLVRNAAKNEPDRTEPYGLLR